MGSRWIVISLIAVLGTQAYSAQKRKATAHRPPPPKALAVDIAAINNLAQHELTQGSKGSSMVRAQILLARAHFSCGEIDAEFGTNFDKALRAFQGDRNLPVTGRVDAATWAALNTDTAPPVTNYTTTADDVKGPFAVITGDMKEQAKLPALGYTSALEGLSEKFHASPELMRALNPKVDFSQAAVQLNVPNVLTMPPGEAARVVVSRRESSVRAYDSTGKLLAFYAATIGSEHDPLPVGEWKINGVARHPRFHYSANLFWDAKNTADKATIQAGPNNPVGVVWIDLSKEHYGIHGTPEPGRVGHVSSHGCIRLTNWDAMELAGMVKPNIPAILQE